MNPRSGAYRVQSRQPWLRPDGGLSTAHAALAVLAAQAALAALAALAAILFLVIPEGRRASPIAAQSAPSELTLVSEIPMGTFEAVALDGPYAYVGLGPRLAILDIHDPSRTAMLGFSDVLSDTVQFIEPDADVAGRVFVAAGRAGTVVFDVTDAARPVEVTRVPGQAWSVQAVGEHVYVLGPQLRILRRNGSDALREVGRIEIPIESFHAVGSTIWLATGAAGIVAYDIGDPSRPAPIGALDTLGSSHDIRVAGDFAFVADGGLRLSVLDVADPRAPRLAGEYMVDLSDEPECYYQGSSCGLDVQRVRLVGDHAVLMVGRTVGAFSGRVQPRVVRLDVSDPTAPIEVNERKFSGNPVAVAADAELIAVAMRPLWWYAGIAPCQLVDGGLGLLDSGLESVGGFSAPAGANAIQMYDDKAWLADVTIGLRTYDLSDPAAPEPVPGYASRYGSVYGSPEARDVVVDSQGPRLAMGGQTAGFLAMSSSGPAGSGPLPWPVNSPFGAASAPSRLLNGCSPPPGDQWFRRITSDGTHDFLLDLNGGLQAFESGAHRRTDLLTLIYANDVAAKDQMVYTTGPEGLTVVDATDPSSLIRTGELATNVHEAAVAVAERAGLTIMAGTAGIMLVDVRGAEPIEVGRYSTAAAARDVAIDGHTAYVAVGDVVEVIDVLDPAAPTLVARARGLQNAFAVATDGVRVAALAAGGLFVYRAHPDNGRAPQLPGDGPPLIGATPDSLLYGHASNAYLQIIAAGMLDGDDMGDLIVGELPTGTGGDERTESNVLVGRADWPERAGTESLALRKIVEPVQTESDSFAIIGAGDLNGDGREDLITLALTQAGRPNQSVKLGLHWSPETWPGRPNLTRPDVTLDVPSDDVPHAAVAADVDGDGLADLIVSGERGVAVVRGRRPWPSGMSLEPPDIRIVPGPAAVSLGDANGDATDDLWVTFDAPALDAALILGRSTWPALVNAGESADVRLGAGHRDLGGAIVPDVSGDGLADLMLVDHATASFGIYSGGTDVADRLTSRTADWSVTGITDTWGIVAMDMTGDGVAEVLVDRHAVFVGRDGRTGSFDIAAGEFDADWRGLGGGALWSLDVDGRSGDDVLVSDSSASVRGRNDAGTIQLFLSPLFTPNPTPPASATPSATPTSSADSTATPTSQAAESPTPSRTWVPSEHDGLLWLPVALRSHLITGSRAASRS